jgi:C4-dicarboxylate transporter, DctM subunit
MTISLLGLAALFLLAFSGLPLGFSMLLVGFAGFAYFRGWEAALSMTAQQVVDMTMNYGFSVIPLFVLMGAFIYKARLADDLFTAAQRWLGQFRGGLAHATLGASAGFGAVCGSSLATAATMTKVAVPEMRRHGYNPAFAGATVAAGGTLGILIPPSVPMVIYGIMTETSIAKLFAAGVIPGLLMMFCYMGAAWYTSIRFPSMAGTPVRSTWHERLQALGRTSGVVALFTLVLGGLYLGVFTPTESAGIGAAGGLALMAWRGFATFKLIKEALLESVQLTATLLLVTIGASVVTNFLTIAGMTSEAGQWVQSLNLPPLGIVMAMCLIYLLLGAVFDGLAMIFLTIPIFFPIVIGLGLDPVWFGIVVVIVVELGLMTPPMGMNVFVVKGLLPEVSNWQIFARILPFVVSALFCLGLVLFFPSLSLWLANMVK